MGNSPSGPDSTFSPGPKTSDDKDTWYVNYCGPEYAPLPMKEEGTKIPKSQPDELGLGRVLPVRKGTGNLGWDWIRSTERK